MSTAPAPVVSTMPAVTTPAPAPATPGPVSTFLKAHERLIIIVVLCLVGWHFYGVAVNYMAERDSKAAATANATLSAQTAATNALATANEAALAQYQQLASQLAAANNAFAQSIVTRNAATQTQQAIDKTLPPPALAARWTTLLNVPPASITPATDGNYYVEPASAEQTVAALEQIPTLQKNFKDEGSVVTNQSNQLASLSQVNTGLENQITALNIRAKDQTAACAANTTALRAAARKSKRNWFILGFIGGFIFGQTLHVTTSL